LLFSCLLVGCGVKQEVYDSVVADLNTAQQELQSVRAELSGTQGELETNKTELEATEEELAAKKTELESSQSELTSLLAEKDILITEKAALQTDYDDLNDEHNAVKQEMADIKEVYPPRHFSSKKELQDWLNENDVSEREDSSAAEFLYEKALEIQAAALEDGYIVSVYIDYFPDLKIFTVVLEAVAGGDVFAWDPETDELLNLSDLSGLMKVGD